MAETKTKKTLSKKLSDKMKANQENSSERKVGGRGHTWTDAEHRVLVKMVIDNQSVIFGNLSQNLSATQIKNKWQEITDAVSM
jgi:hypothetical protein